MQLISSMEGLDRESMLNYQPASLLRILLKEEGIATTTIIIIIITTLRMGIILRNQGRRCHTTPPHLVRGLHRFDFLDGLTLFQSFKSA